MTQERFSNLTVLNSQKGENSQIFPPPTPQCRGGGHRPRTLKTAAQALLGVLTLKMLVCEIF